MTSKNAERPMRRDAARNRERLLEAAAEVFGKDGPQGTVEDVARIAGVGMGTLYRRFPTKEALMDGLVSSMLVEILEDARAARDVPDGQGLRAFLETIGERQSLSYGGLPRMVDSAEHADATQAIKVEIAALLEAGQGHGSVRAEIVPADIFAVVWSLRGVIESTRGVAPDAWRRHLEILFAGLESPARPLTHEPLSGEEVQKLPAR